MARHAEDALFLSVVTLGETERGIAQQLMRNPAFAVDLRVWLDQSTPLFADRILAFDATAARIRGQLSARLGHPSADLLIAATALAHGGMVVTGHSGFAATGVRVERPF